MLRTLAAIAALSIATPAAAEVLQVVDTTPPDTSCDVYAGVSPARARNCYVPAYGSNPAVASAFGPSHRNPAFSITITLNQPATVEANYLQEVFLDTHQGLYPAYNIAIGVDSTTAPCQMQPGDNLDSAGSIGFELHAQCIVALPAGPHTFYALESARQGAFAYRGAVNQSLTVRY